MESLAEKDVVELQRVNPYKEEGQTARERGYERMEISSRSKVEETTGVMRGGQEQIDRRPRGKAEQSSAKGTALLSCLNQPRCATRVFVNRSSGSERRGEMRNKGCV